MTLEAPTARPRIDSYRIAGVGILAVALGLRCVGLSHRWLWYDELLSANFSSHGPLKSLLTVLRFDIHPPLYYLQLSLWSLLGDTAGWLVANSILWSVAAVGLLLVVAGRTYGRRTGLAAAALLAIAPAALAYSDQVRMYAFISTLIIWVWWSQDQWIGRQSLANRLLMALAQLCVVYSHTVGFLMISGCVLYGGLTILGQKDRPKLIAWLLTEAAVAVLTLPVLILGYAHKVLHPLIPTLLDGLTTVIFLGAGEAVVDPVHAAVAFGVVLVFIAIGVSTPRLRLQIGALIVGPLLIAALISFTVKPVWLDRIFTPLIPFIALVLARFAVEPDLESRVSRRARLMTTSAVAVAWLLVGVADQGARIKGDGYRIAALYIRDHARPGDAVAMGEYHELWPFMWYFAGPNWGDPPHSYVANAEWIPVTRRLPGVIQAALEPNVTRFKVQGIDVLLSDPAQAAPNPPGDLFVLGAVPRPTGGRVLVKRISFPPLTLEIWRRHQTGR